MKKLVITGVLSTCFLTAASAQTIVFNEDFQQGIPGSWTIIVNDTSTVDSSVIEFAPGWIALADPENTTDTVAGATSFFTEPAEADRWLITPAFTVGAYGNFIKWQARSHDPSYLDGYYVMVSTTDNQIASFTDTIATLGNENAEWTEREVDLVAKGFANQTIRVAFVLRSYDAFKLYIDDVEVRIDDPVGLEEQTAVDFALYPNPATEIITIKCEDAISIRIFQMDGQLVGEQSLLATQQVDIANLVAGTYLVEVVTSNGIGRSRMVKK